MRATSMVRGVMLAAAVFTALPAIAQPSPREQAKAAFVEGRARYAAGDFAEALEAFRQANALAPHPLMLFNIAQVFEAMDDLPAAIDMYGQYLATNPNDAEAVKGKVGALQATLESWPAVTVESMPPGAQVRVGDAKNPPRGTTPTTLRLPARGHTVFFSLAGHEDAQRPIQLAASDRSTLTVALVPIKPMLRVVTTPPGGAVSVDGQALGPAPIDRAVDGGQRTVRIELDGFEPVERTITLSPTHTRAAPYVLEVPLQKAVPRGDLELTVSPPGSLIFIDGKPHGPSPLGGPLRLTAGLHAVEVRPAAGGETYKEMVTIQADTTVHTEIALDGGIDTGTIGLVAMGVGGLAVAGGVVTGVMALGSSGDLDDCRDDPACGRTQRELDLADDVRSRALITDVLIWSGVAIAAGGAVLYILDADAPAEVDGQAEQAWFVAPMHGGAAAVGRFRF